jgi:NTP pyrophosphatase (non-canonical NTP hydrolase)
MRTTNRDLVYEDIDKERARQDEKWGWSPDDGVTIMSGPDVHAKVSVLAEEFGEVAHAVLEGDDANLEDELIQVAAVAVAWLESRSEFGR